MFLQVPYIILVILCLVVIFHVVPRSFRRLVLLAVSYGIYMNFGLELGLLLFVNTLITYFFGREVGRSTNRRDKRIYLFAGLFSLLGILFVFKYASFLAFAFNQLSAWMNLGIKGPSLELFLPLGISFFTFQMISYLLDVYSEKHKAENDFSLLALYFSFLPKLLMGPLERYHLFKTKLQNLNRATEEGLSSAFRLILYAFFLKMVVADNLAPLVAQVFDTGMAFSITGKVLAWFFFFIQLYADLLAYSLFALGLALLFGIRLSDNFTNPLLAKTFSEFWKTWFISLTQWFREYLYQPIRMRFAGRSGKYLAVALVFLIAALWHGPKVQYIFTALIFSLSLMGEDLLITGKRGNRLLGNSFAAFFYRLLVLLITVFAFGFLRISNLGQFFQLWSLEETTEGINKLEVSASTWAILGVFFLLSFWMKKQRVDFFLKDKTIFIRWILYVLLLIFVAVFASTESLTFYYFKF